LQAFIKADELTKKYRIGRDDIYALNRVSVEVHQGELTILRGRSGSGKTTLLNQLCLLDRPDKGEVLYEESEMTQVSDKSRDDFRRLNIGIVFQSVALIPHMTALENVDFAMKIAGIGYKERKIRALECLSMVGLSKRTSHMPAELSGGEQQRVAIARAMSHKPKVLYADEPTAELDTSTGLQVVKVFLDLVETEKITVVMTTHDPELMELGHMIYTLTDGEITDEQRNRSDDRV